MRAYEGCDKCKYTNKKENEYPCCKCSHSQERVNHYIPMTNADRIRNMSDEELAEFFDRTTNQDREDWESIGCFGCVFYGTHHQEKNSTLYECEGCEFENGILAWLQAEVKEGNSNENT